jgi:hypothetical protein
LALKNKESTAEKSVFYLYADVNPLMTGEIFVYPAPFQAQVSQK